MDHDPKHFYKYTNELGVNYIKILGKTLFTLSSSDGLDSEYMILNDGCEDQDSEQSRNRYLAWRNRFLGSTNGFIHELWTTI
jgi:hypothetical protein